MGLIQYIQLFGKTIYIFLFSKKLPVQKLSFNS